MNRILAVFRWLLAKKSRLIIATLILSAMGLFFWIRSKNGKEPKYQTIKVEKGTLISSVSASGSILTTNLLPVTTSATGMVKKVFFKDGDTVYQGQKLAEIELDSSAAQQHAAAYSSYLSTKNSLAAAEVNYWTLQSAMFTANQKFINDAVARNLVSSDPTYIQQSADWLAAEAKFKNNQQTIAQNKAALTNASLILQIGSPIITAPQSGTIDNITLVAGMTLTSTSSSDSEVSGNRIAVIRVKGEALATFNITEVDVSRINQGQKATITLDSIADKTFTGQVVSVDKVGSTSNGVTTYPIVIKLDTETPEILPHMSATANIILETKSDVLIVPSSAITTSNDQSTVRVIKGKQELIVTVETGLTSDSGTEIISGLSEGDEVITGTTTTTGEQTRSVFSPSFGGGAFRSR